MLTVALLSSSYAKEPPSLAPESASSTSAHSAENTLLAHKHYTNKKGSVVHSPAHTRTGKAPDGASAQCGDGSYSFSQNHRGTCSHHGGVVHWLR
ncbi:MAG: DUF3761 domain-containing protein [Burkholderiales bacterium]|nr:DUF3761 domain-containing protein [Burkholderiales bacterium]